LVYWRVKLGISTYAQGCSLPLLPELIPKAVAGRLRADVSPL
jgi:hypothetical protein